MLFDRTNSIILDIQCFLDDAGEYLIKEMAYAYCDRRSSIQHMLFKAPCNFKDLQPSTRKRNDYIRHNVHGLSWFDGTIPYSCLKELLDAISDSIILVKGRDKKKCLKKHLPNTKIIDLSIFDRLANCKKSMGVTSCDLHFKFIEDRCAVINVGKVFLYMEEKKMFLQ